MNANRQGTNGGGWGQTSHPLSDRERWYWRMKAQEYRREAYAIERMLEADEEQRNNIDK